MDTQSQDAGHACHDHSAHDHADHGGGNPWVTSAQATLHCLTGCVVGELLGLTIGVSIGLPPLWTTVLATLMSYASGLTLGVVPVARDRGVSLVDAFRIIWLGEVISIGTMEIAMNIADYLVGGMSAPSLLHLSFWMGIAAAIPAGFLAAWPVNAWLLKKNLKNCH